MQYEPVIGLEVHAQLQTRSKMFCRCGTGYAGAEPNTHICPICAGFPGVLPIINAKAVELALRVGLALNCEVTPASRFDRKSYPYPDLPKGYQVSQYDLPLAQSGCVLLNTDGASRQIGIVRVHMEEDTGRLLHRRSADGTVYSLVDLNRSGVPLLEIVSAPDIRSAAEARAYVQKLRQLLRYIDASTGNMEEGALRVDANVSVRPVGTPEFGAKVEIKNLNSFGMVERALEYEIRRQTEALEGGEVVTQQTRGWDDAARVTVLQRTKEFASDYRYFPEPDLPPLVMTPARVEAVRGELAELPDVRRARFMTQYGLRSYDADVLTQTRETAEYFEEVVTLVGTRVPAKQAANWITGEMFRLTKQDGVGVAETRVSPELLAQLLELIAAGEISFASGRVLLEVVYNTGRSPRELAEEMELLQTSEVGDLDPLLDAVIASNPGPVGDFQRGKKQAVKVLIGQVMRETKGAARADVVENLLIEKLTGNGSGGS